MLGFNAGRDRARGDRVGFVGEGRVSPPAPPGFGGLYNRSWFEALAVTGPRAERVVGSGWESPLAGGLTRPSPRTPTTETAPLIFVSVR